MSIDSFNKLDKMGEKLPFEIGEQFDLHEFDLSNEGALQLGEYEYDIYSCKSILFEKVKVEGLINVLLYYNCDVLARIKYRFLGDSIETMLNLIGGLCEKENIITYCYLDGFVDVEITSSKYEV